MNISTVNNKRSIQSLSPLGPDSKERREDFNNLVSLLNKAIIRNPSSRSVSNTVR